MEDDELLIQLGKNIRIFRIKKRISQLKLSKLTKIDRAYISEIETGKNNPTIRTLRRIAKQLNVRVGDLLRNC